MKMNKKGFSLIELVVSITLISIVLISLINTLVKLKEIYTMVNDNAEIEVSTSSIVRIINNDFINNGGIKKVEQDEDDNRSIVIYLNNGKKRKIELSDCEGDEISINNNTGKKKINKSSIIYYNIDENDEQKIKYIKTISNIYRRKNNKETISGNKFESIVAVSNNYDGGTLKPNTCSTVTKIIIKSNNSKYDIYFTSLSQKENACP